MSRPGDQRRRTVSLLDTVVRTYGALRPQIAKAAAHQRDPVRSALIQGSDETAVALRSSVHPGSTDWTRTVQRLRAIGAEHARSGHPISDLLIARRVHRHIVVDHVRHIGKTRGLPADEVLDTVDAVINACNRVSAELISGCRETEPRSHHADRARAVFVHELLCGTLAPERCVADAQRFGVDTGREYVALRARPRAGRSMDELARSLGLGMGRSNGGGLGAIVDGDLVGFVTSQPDEASCGVLGLGPPRRLELLHESFRMASRALHAADRQQLTGVCAFERLGLLPAVLFDEATGEALRRRYLDPLGGTAFAAEITETLRAFLTHGMQAPRTARALCVHTNTVRYRIAKFEELTGVTFRGNRTAAFELLWALQHCAVHARSPWAAAG